MQSSLLYFTVGLTVFFMRLVTDRLPAALRLLLYTAAGAGAGLFCGLIAGYPLPAAALPGWLSAVPGAAAGLLIFELNRGGWIVRPLLAYLSTIIPGLVLAVIYYFTAYIYMQCVETPVYTGISWLQLWSLFAAVGFAMILGYTFPERWFRRRGALDNDGTSSGRPRSGS